MIPGTRFMKGVYQGKPLIPIVMNVMHLLKVSRACIWNLTNSFVAVGLSLNNSLQTVVYWINDQIHES